MTAPRDVALLVEVNGTGDQVLPRLDDHIDVVRLAADRVALRLLAGPKAKAPRAELALPEAAALEVTVQGPVEGVAALQEQPAAGQFSGGLPLDAGGVALLEALDARRHVALPGFPVLAVDLYPLVDVLQDHAALL